MKIRVNANFDKIMKHLEKLREIREKYYKDSKMRIRISGVKINKSQDVESMNDFYKDFGMKLLVNYNPWQSAYDNDINEIKAYAPNYIEKCLSGGTVKLIRF